MFIRYHLFYYATGCLLAVMGMYFHFLFFFGLILYCVWMFQRLSLKHLFVLLVFISFLFIPRIQLQELPNVVEGTVIKTSEKYCYLKTDVGRIKLYHNEDIHYQDNIKVKIIPLEMNENTNDYAFNEKIYLYSQKIFYKAKIDELISLDSSYTLYQWIEQRLSLQTGINDYQRLFLFGERTEDIQDDYQQLSEFSLVHLFALSGMHVHILHLILKKSFGYIFEQNLSKWMSLLCIGIYIFSIPMQISLFRAFFVLFLHELLKKWFHELDILSFLVMISLFYNPYIIFNISFIFSYFVYFIVLLTRKLKYSWILVYCSTIPIVLSLNYQIPFTAFLIGNILTPFIELFYCLCCFSIFFPVLEIGLDFCIRILKLIIQFLDVTNTYFQFSKPSLSFVIMFYILFFVIVYKLELKKSIVKNVSMLVAFMIAFFVYGQYKIYGEITMIDVGQGDCTLIRLPMNQGNVLIDTGGNKDYDLATKTIIPYLKAIGIQRLDYVYISHNDYDHCGAIESLKEHFKVEHVIDKYEDYRKIGSMEVRMLQTNQSYLDENDQSLVMQINVFDTSLLMTGDISQQVENDLYKRYGKLDIDILKVSHHGSQTASSPILFEMIHPQIAMIGVKENNIYHHPSSQVINRLTRKNIHILRTDKDGMFHIRFIRKSRYILK